MERSQLCSDGDKRYICPLYLDWLAVVSYENQYNLQLDDTSAFVAASTNAIGKQAYYDPAEDASDDYKAENQSIPFIAVPTNTKYLKIAFQSPGWHPTESPDFDYNQVDKIAIRMACAPNLDKITDDKYVILKEIGKKDDYKVVLTEPFSREFSKNCFCRVKVNFYGEDNQSYGGFLSRPLQVCANPPAITRPVVRTNKATLMLGPGGMGPAAGTLFNGHILQTGGDSQVKVFLDIYPSIDVNKYFDKLVLANPSKYPNSYSGGAFLNSVVRKFSTTTYAQGPFALPALNLILNSNYCYRFAAQNKAGDWKGNAYCGEDNVSLAQLYTNPKALSVKLVKANDPKGASVWIAIRNINSSQYKALTSPKVIGDGQEISWNVAGMNNFCYQARALNRAGFNAGSEYCIQIAEEKAKTPPQSEEVEKETPPPPPPPKETGTSVVKTNRAQDPTLTSIRLSGTFSTTLTKYEAIAWLWAFRVGPHVPEVFWSPDAAHDFCQNLAIDQKIEQGNSKYPARYRIGLKSDFGPSQGFGDTINNLEPENFYCYQARAMVNGKLIVGKYALFALGQYRLPIVSVDDARASIDNIGKDWVKITAQLKDDGLDPETKTTVIVYEPLIYDSKNEFQPICSTFPQLENGEFKKWPLFAKTNNEWRNLDNNEKATWTIWGLTSGKAYCYQAWAVNKKGAAASSFLSFVARSDLDLVQVDPANDIGYDKARVNATIKDVNNVENYWFELTMIEGTPRQNCKTSIKTESKNYAKEKKISALVTGLCPGGKYRYHAIVSSKPDKNRFTEYVSSNNSETFQALSINPKLFQAMPVFNPAKNKYEVKYSITDWGGNQKVRMHVKINGRDSEGRCIDVATYQRYFDITAGNTPYLGSQELDWQFVNDTFYCYEIVLEKSVAGAFKTIGPSYPLSVFGNDISRGAIRTQLTSPIVQKVAPSSADRIWDQFTVRGKLLNSGDSTGQANVWFGVYFQDDRMDSKGNPYIFHTLSSNEKVARNGQTFYAKITPQFLIEKTKLTYNQVKSKTVCYFPIASNGVQKSPIGEKQCFKFLSRPELEITEIKMAPMGIYATVVITNDGGCDSDQLGNQNISAYPNNGDYKNCGLGMNSKSEKIASWKNEKGQTVFYSFLKLKNNCSYDVKAGVNAGCISGGGLNASSLAWKIQFSYNALRAFTYNQWPGCPDVPQDKQEHDLNVLTPYDFSGSCNAAALINIGRYWYDFGSPQAKKQFSENNSFSIYKALELRATNWGETREDNCDSLARVAKEKGFTYQSFLNNTLPAGTNFYDKDTGYFIGPNATGQNRIELMKVLERASVIVDKGYPVRFRCCHASGQHFINLLGVDRGANNILDETDYVYVSDSACNTYATNNQWSVERFIDENCGGRDDCQDGNVGSNCTSKVLWYELK